MKKRKYLFGTILVSLTLFLGFSCSKGIQDEELVLPEHTNLTRNGGGEGGDVYWDDGILKCSNCNLPLMNIQATDGSCGCPFRNDGGGWGRIFHDDETNREYYAEDRYTRNIYYKYSTVQGRSAIIFEPEMDLYWDVKLRFNYIFREQGVYYSHFCTLPYDYTLVRGNSPYLVYLDNYQAHRNTQDETAYCPHCYSWTGRLAEDYYDTSMGARPGGPGFLCEADIDYYLSSVDLITKQHMVRDESHVNEEGVVTLYRLYHVYRLVPQ